MNRVVIASLVCMLMVSFFSHADSKNGNTQQKFISIVTKSQIEAANANNDMQRATIKINRDREICSTLRDVKVSNWNGIVNSIYAGRDGSGILYIEVSPNVLLVSRDLLGMAKASIPRNTKLYDKVSNMSEGDAVVFSGEFIPDDDACADEASITLEGGLSKPNFIFRFNDINKKNYSKGEDITDVNPEETVNGANRVITKLRIGFYNACVMIGKEDDAGAMKAIDDIDLSGDGKTPKINKEAYQGIKNYFMQYRHLNKDTCADYSEEFVSGMLHNMAKK